MTSYEGSACKRTMGGTVARLSCLGVGMDGSGEAGQAEALRVVVGRMVWAQ